VVQGPATSLAFEPAEANVMDRPPRDLATERLVSVPLLVYSYISMGIPQSLCCMGAYLWVFTKHGIKVKDIFMINPKDDTQWTYTASDNCDDCVPNFNGAQQADILRQVRGMSLTCSHSE
jgi:hypothetical protein